MSLKKFMLFVTMVMGPSLFAMEEIKIIDHEGKSPTQHDNDYFAQNHAMASISMKKDEFKCWATQQEPNAPFKLKQSGF
jgi:hypothetical protein